MSERSVLAALALLGLSLHPATAAAAGCVINKIAEIPVTMTDHRPMVRAKINGEDAKFVADSGSFADLLTRAAVARYRLKTRPAPPEARISGVGGVTDDVYLTFVKNLTLFGLQFTDAQFVVAGNDFGEAAGLGQSIFRIGDVEYDLANGVIRILRPQDCGNAVLAYWAAGKPYSVIDLDWATKRSPHTTGSAYLNGAKIRVMFDTGFYLSSLSLEAAKRAGIAPDSPAAVPFGHTMGLGPHSVDTWVAPFGSFKLGDEEVRNARLRFGDLADARDSSLRKIDMFIGADFFLSHRVYVASSQHKLYFTYNGGPVFDLTSGGGAAAADHPGGDGAPTDSPDTPTVAAGFSRRGAACVDRGDFERGLADLTRATELAPTEARNGDCVRSYVPKVGYLFVSLMADEGIYDTSP